MRGALEEGGQFYNYCEPGIRAQFQENITKKIDWLYGDGENAPLNDYEQGYSDFRAIGEPCRTRYRYYEALPETRKYH